MRRKSIPVLSLAVLVLVLSSCSSKPEEALLKSYFNATSLKDITTLSTMALNPISIEFKSWEIVGDAVEKVAPASLPELAAREEELKKAVEDSVGITLNADDARANAKFELENARTAAARNQARRQLEEAEKAYEAQRERHNQVQKDYNDAKSEAAKEEEIALFSLGAGDLPGVRSFAGDVQSKEVDVKVTTKENEVKTYRFFLRRYVLKDEAAGIPRRGRWIITRSEVVG